MLICNKIYIGNKSYAQGKHKINELPQNIFVNIFE
jgi:hypothetical protein